MLACCQTKPIDGRWQQGYIFLDAIETFSATPVVAVALLVSHVLAHLGNDVLHMDLYFLMKLGEICGDFRRVSY